MTYRVLVRLLGSVILAASLFCAHGSLAEDCDGIPPPCSAALPKGTVQDPHVLPVPPDDGRVGIDRVRMNALMLYNDHRFVDLDNLIARYSKLQDRFDDGRFKLSGIAAFYNFEFEVRRKEYLPNIELWRVMNPKSPGAALAEAVYWRLRAWEARGNGFANSVSPEGQRLFRERLETAQKLLNASESYAASIPLWYIESLEVDLGLGASLKQQLILYDRGIKAFPDYDQLHFQMIRALLPKWGGSDEAVTAFIEAVVKRSPAPLKAQMYTRLWWYVDNVTPLDESIFNNVKASWPRMKAGFESLGKSYPDSLWNRTNFAAFACRAGDMATYSRLRTEIGDQMGMFAKNAFPSNQSLEVCDERAASR
jgi:hypothetical protein